MSTHMRCRLMLLVVLSAALLSNCFTIGGPARSFALVAARGAAKIPRSIRAPFSNPQMMTARGFGKRSHPAGTGPMAPAGNDGDSVAWSFGKPGEAKFFNDLVADGDALDEIRGNDAAAPTADSFPIEWLAEELAQNPQGVLVLLRRFVDVNRDGIITGEELLRQPTSTSTASARHGGGGGVQQPPSAALLSSSSTNGVGLDMY